MPEFEVPKSKTVIGSDGSWGEELDDVVITYKVPPVVKEKTWWQKLLDFLKKYWIVLVLPLILFVIYKQAKKPQKKQFKKR